MSFRERPIMFTAPMVRAILAGRKTRTRRIARRFYVTHRASARRHEAIVWRHRECGFQDARMSVGSYGRDFADGTFDFVCPYADGTTTYVVDGPTILDLYWLIAPRGDNRLWVKETHCRAPLVYAADHARRPAEVKRWTPSILMRRSDSRIDLDVVSVRLLSAQSMTEQDALEEGVSSVAEYAALFDKINGKDSWTMNPMVWDIEFRRRVT